jgi:CheY-like chemotaxis protein
VGPWGGGTASAMVPKRLTSYQWWLAMAEEADRHWHEVLVVEDEAEVRDAISNLLHFRAFTVRSAPDGRQAIAQLRDGYRPCLILLDLTMPGMDGAAFRHEQQATADCAHIPVVIVSGHDDGQGIAATLGARDFLKKPVRITTLLDALDRHCPHCQR